MVKLIATLRNKTCGNCKRVIPRNELFFRCYEGINYIVPSHHRYTNLCYFCLVKLHNEIDERGKNL